MNYIKLRTFEHITIDSIQKTARQSHDASLSVADIRFFVLFIAVGVMIDGVKVSPALGLFTRDRFLIACDQFLMTHQQYLAYSSSTILLKSRSSEVEASGLIIKRKGTDLLLIA